MAEALILAGGMVWLAVTIVMVGYTTILGLAKDYRAMSVSLACTAFVLFLGVWAIVYAEQLSRSVWYG
jgi:hypothetical protein